MKKLLLFTVLIGLASCGGVKKTQTALNTGNYNAVINDAVQRLSKNKTKKGNQKYVLLLEEAFGKNTERELEQIAFLQKDGNGANLQSIYENYLQLKSVQQRIRPLLPLAVYDENREARFNLFWV